MNQAAGLFKLTENIKGKKGVKTFAITSGKGGVGKTNVVVNLAVAIADTGLDVVVVDADYGLGNIDILLGIEPEFDLTDLFKKGKKIEEIIVEKNKIRIVPAGSGIQSLSQLTEEQEVILHNEMERLKENNDVLIIDTAAGISDNVISLLLSSDEIFLVVSPEPTSIVDAYAVIKVVTELDSFKRFSVIANMVNDANEASELYLKLARATSKFLNKKIGTMGFITKDKNIVKSVRHQVPVIIKYPDSVCSKDILRISKKIIKKVKN